MAFSSSGTWRYGVFVSYHGPDVPKTYVSQLRKHIRENGITMFSEEGIIAPAPTQAIEESRISLVVLSKNYASSSWCLDELVEILKCREAIGQIVIPIFYGVDPSDVLKQTGEFGIAFNEACEGKTEEERQTWSQALTDAGNIAGEYFLNWNNASDLIEKIARDVSEKLNTTMSGDFEDMVGLEAHLEKIKSLLHLDNEDETMIVGICGPAGVGKTTIARALHNRLSSSFWHSHFRENIKGNLKLSDLQQLLSMILNRNGIRTDHLGAMKERRSEKKVLIILDDVDDLKELEALTNEIHRFGLGSRMIVIVEDQRLLEQHGINNTYHVGLPTEEEAQKIFCSYAFGKSSRPDGFEKLIKRVTKHCSNLPLCLSVMGAFLRGKKENVWKVIMHRLENSLDQDVEGVLGVRLQSLPEKDQFLFLTIAIFCNYKYDDYVKALLAGKNLNVRLGLKSLAYKSLIHISTEGKIVVHKLLHEVIRRYNLRKGQILIESHDEICDILENEFVTTSMTGKSQIQISTEGKQVRREAVKRLRPKEQVVIHADEFRDVLKNDSESISVTGQSLIQISAEGKQVGREVVQRQEPSSSNKWIGKSKSWCFTRMAFVVVINLLLEIVSAVADQLSSIRKPHFARISLLMSSLSVVLSIIDLTYKIRAHKARFQCKWPIPWFYYPSRGYNIIFGSFTDTVLLFCAVGQLIVSTINYSFMERRRDGPIKVSVWPLFFAIGMVGSKFMEKPTISKDNSCNKNVLIDLNLNE